MAENTAFTIRLAGRLFRIHPLHEDVRGYCRDYLVTDEVMQLPEVIRIEITQEDIDFERKKSASEDRKEGIPVRQFTDGYLETLAVYRKIADELLAFDTLLFHGSVIAVDGKGYLFTAKSGTGKSTHTRLWREQFGERAVMVNDDKPLLKITEHGVIACGTPWDGKHRLSTNMEVPLKAICILKRDTSNHIEPADRREVYPLIVQQTNRSLIPANMPVTLTLIDRLLQKVPVYRLGCNMDPEAARVAYEGMQKINEDM